MKTYYFGIFLKLVLISIFVSILLLEIFYNKNIIINIISNNIIFLLILLVLQLCYLLIYNLRTYSVYKNFLNKSISIYFWSTFFFKSLIYNISINSAGTIYRALVLKRMGIKYEKFLSIFLLLFLSYFIINFFYILLEVLFFTDLNLKLKFSYLLIFLLLFFFMVLIPKTLTIILKKLILININIKKIIYIFNFLVNFFKKKSLNKSFYNIFILGSALHFFELLTFYFSCKIFITDFSFEKILLLFVVSFLLDRIPFVSSIVGSNEIIFGFFSTYLGLLFHEGVLIKFIIRLTGVIVIVFSFIYSFFSLKSKKSIL
jgi:hypothetical protein